MYANGGWNEEKPVNKKESLTALRKTLQVYYKSISKIPPKHGILMTSLNKKFFYFKYFHLVI